MLIGLGFVFSIWKSCKETTDHEKFTKQYTKEYWSACKIQFIGIVKDKKVLEKGSGYLCLDLVYANKPDGYIFNFKDEVFVCQILKDHILFSTEAIQVEIGDSITYNMNGDRAEKRFRDGINFVTFENSVFFPTYYSNLFYPNGFSCE